MIFSLLVYTAVLILIFYGGVFAGHGAGHKTAVPSGKQSFLHSFNNDILSEKASSSTKGIAAVCIMLHHISQAKGFQESGELSVFRDIGFLFVGIFFFYSGYGLFKSLESKPGYLKSFFRKRIPAIVIPFYVMTVFYTVFTILSGTEMPASRWILSLSGLVLLNDQSWFPVVIIIMYTAFFLAFRFCGTKRNAVILITAVTLAQEAFFIFWCHSAWWAPESCSDRWWTKPCALWYQGEWWVNSTMAFPAGIIFAMHENKITGLLRKKYFPKVFILILLTGLSIAFSFFCAKRFSYWSEFSGDGLGRINKAICLASQTVEIVLFVLTLAALKMKFYPKNAAADFFGKITLEFYLMQRIAVNSCFFLTEKFHPAVYALAVFSMSLLLALIFRMINRSILKRIIH